MAMQRGSKSATFAPDHKLAVKWVDNGAAGSSKAGPKDAANGSLRSSPNKIYTGKFSYPGTKGTPPDKADDD